MFQLHVGCRVRAGPIPKRMRPVVGENKVLLTVFLKSMDKGINRAIPTSGDDSRLIIKKDLSTTTDRAPLTRLLFKLVADDLKGLRHIGKIPEERVLHLRRIQLSAKLVR